MRNCVLTIISLVFLASCSPQLQTGVYVSNRPAAQGQPVTPPPPASSYQTFYDELSPYGSWIDYPNYGYVWRPNVEPDFRPYATNGHWVYSDAGWTWVSNYSWGWAAFHYGRWFYEGGYGWLWLPGHEWAPAWVTWGRSGNYYGWAPIAPKVNISEGRWTPPENSWNFVPAEHITKPNVVNYVVAHNNTTITNNTTIVKNVTIINNVTNNHITNNNVTNNVTNNNITNNVVYNKGPEVTEVENVANIKVQHVVINENAKPGAASLSNNKLFVYRPVIRPAVETDAKKPAPQRVETYRQGNGN